MGTNNTLPPANVGDPFSKLIGGPSPLLGAVGKDFDFSEAASGLANDLALALEELKFENERALLHRRNLEPEPEPIHDIQEAAERLQFAQQSFSAQGGVVMGIQANIDPESLLRLLN